MYNTLKQYHTFRGNEVHTFLGLGVFRCQERVVSDTDTDPDTYNYIELCDFLKLTVVSVCRCLCRVQFPCLYLCFIGGNTVHVVNFEYILKISKILCPIFLIEKYRNSFE